MYELTYNWRTAIEAGIFGRGEEAAVAAKKKRFVLILLGGMWHDFDAYAAAMQPVFETAGYRVEATYDLDTLGRLDQVGCDLLLSYTCLTKHRPGFADAGPEKLTGAQVAGLRRWVRQGGALLGAHAATVIGDSSPHLGRLFGGVFLSHPEPFAFTIYPLSGEHPITSGLPAFEVLDEFYIQQVDPGVTIHMVALYQGAAHPMVWSRVAGRGRVACVAPGHFPHVWNNPAYQRLMLQTANWLLKKGGRA
jgi:type 1 glutamine amidotransferase